MSLHTSDLTALTDLDDQIAATAAAVLTAIDDLAHLAADLVAADNARRAALARAGYHDRRPPAGELLVEVVHGCLGCLRPHLPFVTVESAARAADALRHRPRRFTDDEAFMRRRVKGGDDD